MIEIVSYMESWPSEFKEIGSALRKGLGGLAVRIDHIGSTSVPGLPSKDIIDIQISVASLNEEVHLGMSALGYTRTDIYSDHRPPLAVMEGKEWEKWYFRPPSLQRRTHTHMRVMGRANQRYPLLFRDYLRTHPASAEAYAELKRRLAQNLVDPETYSDVKDPAVDLIYLAAEAWAVAIKWMPDESDA